MVVDTSAILAIPTQGDDAERYALASATGKPLLFKGDDFSKTDIPAAV